MKARFELFNFSADLFKDKQGLECLKKETQQELGEVFAVYEKGHISKNTYDITWKDSIKKANKDVRHLKLYTHIMSNETYSRILRDKEFWKKNAKSHFAPEVREQIEKEGLHLTQPTDFLRHQHEEILYYIREWINFAELELAAKKKKLPQGFSIQFKLYLDNLKQIVKKEEENIKELSFIRFMRLLDNGVSILDDDNLFHIRAELEEKSIDASDKIRKLNKSDERLIREGYHSDTFHYFFVRWQPDQLQRFYKKILPATLHKELEDSNLWKKASFFISRAKKKRAAFFSKHAYQLAEVYVQLRHTEKSTDKLTISCWDDQELIKQKGYISSLEKNLQNLIKTAEKEEPKGFWSRIFKKETRKVFSNYKADLQQKLLKTRDIKQKLQQKINNWSSKQEPLSFGEASRLDFTRVTEIRGFIKESGQTEATDYLNKTDMLSRLLEEINSPRKLYIPQKPIVPSETKVTIHRVNEQILDKVIALADASTSSKDQKQALLALRKLMIGNNQILKQDITKVKNELLPLFNGNTEEQEVSFRNLMKSITYRYLFPQIESVNSTVFQFVQRYDKYANTHFADEFKSQSGEFATKAYLDLKEIFSHFPLLIDKHDTAERIMLIRAASSEKVNYYQEILKIASDAIKSHPVPTDTSFDAIVNQLGNDELIAQYGSKLFHTLLVQKNYALLVKHSFFQTHINHPTLTNAIHQLLLKELEKNASEELFKLCSCFAVKSEEISKRVDAYRLTQIIALRDNTADESKVIEFISHAKHSPYPFPATDEAKKSFGATLGQYDAGWGKQQKLLYDNFGSLEEKQSFYTSWLKSLMLGKHSNVTLLTQSNEDDLINLFGIENLKNLLYPLILSKIDEFPLLTLKTLSSIFTENLTIKLKLGSISQQLYLAEKRSENKKRGIQAWENVKTEYEALDQFRRKTTEFLCEKVAEMKEILRLHEKEKDSEQYIFASAFLEEAANYLDEVLLQAVLNSSFSSAYFLNMVASQLPESDKKNRLKSVYDSRYDIVLTNSKFTNELNADAITNLNKKSLKQHVLFINEKILDLVRYTSLQDNDHYHKQVGILKMMSKDFPSSSPLKECLLYTAKYMEEGKSSLSPAELAYITYHDDFKLTLDCIDAIAKDKKLPIKPEEFKKAVEQLMKSPYFGEAYKDFWQEILKSCEEKPRSLYMISLIYQLGTYKHRQFFMRETNVSSEIEHEFKYMPYGTLPGQEFNDELSQTKKELQNAEEACERIFTQHNEFSKLMKNAADAITQDPQKIRNMNPDQVVNQFKPFLS